MPSPDQAASSLPDDPALLRIEGPIATITLNRPAAFNSIDLSIARKLEQLGAEVEASDEIKVLVIEGEGRAFCAGGDLQTIGAAAAADTIAPVVGELLRAREIATWARLTSFSLANGVALMEAAALARRGVPPGGFRTGLEAFETQLPPIVGGPTSRTISGSTHPTRVKGSFAPFQPATAAVTKSCAWRFAKAG